MAGFRLNGKWGFVDELGKMVITPKYDVVSDFSGGLAMAASNGKYGYIDPMGRVAISFQYDEADYFNDGFAIVKNIQDEITKEGIIDTTGR